ncbi:hypothetical protein AgCh_033482 [Apium graveolens]
MATSSSGVLESRGRNREVVDSIFRVGSLNVGTLTGKFLELVDGLKKRHVDAVCVQETKWKGDKIKETNGFKLWGVAKNMLGITSGKIHDQREAWWWNEDVQERVKAKQARLKEIICCNKKEKFDTKKTLYKEAKRLSKRAVVEAKDKAYEEMYIEIEWELRKMGKGKATGPEEIPIETGKIPHEWKLIMVIPIYKNKGDA